MVILHFSANPDNQPGGNADCGILRNNDNWEWADNPCDYDRGFVCERARGDKTMQKHNIFS